MKKKKILSIITACAMFSAVCISACVPKGLEAHSWSKRWASNSKAHWHGCTDAGCNGRDEYGEHDWQVTTVYRQPTCGDVGYGQYTCSVCKATMGNTATPATIPATGDHKFELDTVDVEPGCGEEGYGSYICSVCYDYALLPLPATGEHDFSGAYQTTEQGHYHVCRNGCGTEEEIEPHVKGEGVRHEPVGTADGKTEYRCTVCNYLMDWEVIPNQNVLAGFEVKFVKANNSSNVAIPEQREDGEYYVKLNVSSNASGGYKLEFAGYNAKGDAVSVPNNIVKLYHYDEYTGKKTELTLGNMGSEAVGYLGYLNSNFYIARATADVSLLIECTQGNREPVSLKVHIRTS